MKALAVLLIGVFFCFVYTSYIIFNIFTYIMRPITRLIFEEPVIT
jgi:hypothetical protein